MEKMKRPNARDAARDAGLPLGFRVTATLREDCQLCDGYGCRTCDPEPHDLLPDAPKPWQTGGPEL